MSNLMQTVHSFLMNPGESGKIVSFVYLAGPTVQVRVIHCQVVFVVQHLANIFLQYIFKLLIESVQW